MNLKFSIEGRPEFSVATIYLPAGETVRVEASAMAWMDACLTLRTKAKGGFARLLTGEDLFINEFHAKGQDGEIAVAPPSPGDIGHYELRGESIYLQNSCYLASSMNVDISTKWQGLVRGLFSGNGLFLIRAAGTGNIWFNSYGSLVEIRDPGDGFVVDTNHIVAFTEGLEYSVNGLGTYKSLFFSGEGLVCRFRGQGTLWIQSHKVAALAWWLRSYRRVKIVKGR